MKTQMKTIKEYVTPQIVVITVEQTLLNNFSTFAVDSKTEGTVSDSDPEDDWGTND